MDDMSATGVPGLFLDGDDFHDAFLQALQRLPVERLPEFHEQLARAGDASVHGDPRPLTNLLMGLVAAERLSTNHDYKRAVKDVEEMDEHGPPAVIDHHAHFAALRAG